MANTVVLKRSSVAGKIPSTSDLQLGELAINTNDGNLFFKKSVQGTDTVLSVATLTGSQTLTNKTLSSPVLQSPSITGVIRDNNNSTGSNGSVLTSTGTGVQWVAPTANTLDGLTDVVISSPTANQVLTFTGSAWINADPTVTVASAVFATNAQSDLGSVTDLVIGLSEDLGYISDIAVLIYDMGQLRLDGIVSLSNIDQSVKADYIGYSIIFGF